MKIAVKSWEGKDLKTVNVSDAIFDLEPKASVLERVVRWQLSKKREGNHKTKGISDIRGTTKKPHRQKGTGRARQGSLRSPQFRGGAVIFGPVVRSHAHGLPKKIRSLGLKMAFSSKARLGKLYLLDSLELPSMQTKKLIANLKKLGIGSALIVGTDAIPLSVSRASRGIIDINVLPQCGVNVYDILRHDFLCIQESALSQLEERLV